MRDQLNPAYKFEDKDVFKQKNESKIRYEKNQQSQMTQTLAESTSLSSENLLEKTPSFKRRFSLFLNKSSQGDDSKTNDYAQSIGNRLRSFSLLNSSGTSDFFNIGSLIKTKTKSTSSFSDIDNCSGLDENNYLNLKNSKLVLNNEKKFEEK